MNERRQRYADPLLLIAKLWIEGDLGSRFEWRLRLRTYDRTVNTRNLITESERGGSRSIYSCRTKSRVKFFNLGKICIVSPGEEGRDVEGLNACFRLSTASEKGLRNTNPMLDPAKSLRARVRICGTETLSRTIHRSIFKD
jgi:hypothetical protein